MRRCVYCLLPLAREGAIAHPACEERQRAYLDTDKVRRLLKTTTAAPPPRTDDTHAKILALVQGPQALTYAAIGARFRLSAQRVSQIARRAGVRRFEDGTRADTVERKREVADALLAGEPVKEVARRTRTPLSLVYRWRAALAAG